MLDFEFPEEFTAFTNALAVFNISFFAMAPFECWFPESNFFADLVFTTLWPIGTAFILLALYAHFHQGSFFTLFLLLTYLVLPSAASKIFSAFRYDSFCAGAFGTMCDGEWRHFLAVDYSIEAEWTNAVYQATMIYAISMVFVYAVGVPALYAVLLYRHQRELSIHAPIKLSPSQICSKKKRADLQSDLANFYFGDETLGHGMNDNSFDLLLKEANDPRFMEWAQGNSPLPEETQRLISLLSEETQELLSTGGGLHPAASSIIPLLSQFYKYQEDEYDKLSHDHMLSFLLGSWEQRTYWFEVFEVLRRLALSGVLVLFGPGSAVQAGMSILICSASIKMYSLYNPFREDDDDFLQELAQWQLFMVLLSTVFARMEITGGTCTRAHTHAHAHAYARMRACACLHIHETAVAGLSGHHGMRVRVCMCSHAYTATCSHRVAV